MSAVVRKRLGQIAERTLPTSKLNIIQACMDEKLFRPFFKDVATWQRWFIFLKTLFALPMTASEFAFYQQCTQRQEPPLKQFNESWLIVGRRGGKSVVVSIIGVFLAVFYDWKPFLAPGERGTIAIIAADRKQARVIFRYVEALLKNPLLSELVERETMESFDLTNSITIEVVSASFRTTRGYTIVAALLDEIAFWRSENSSNPDFEILEAIRPATATIPGSMILAISSPYARRGALYETYDKHFGEENPNILVWQAPTLVMNPSLPKYIVDQAYSRDPAKADAEYGANFRKDIQALVSIEVVNACTDFGVHERPFTKGIEYTAFTDPSGGSQDSFTLGIAHAEGDKRVLDLIRSVRPPFDPDSVVQEFSDVLKLYGLSEVTGDRYAGEWTAKSFEKQGITYNVTDRSKSKIYNEVLPLLNSNRARLLDLPELRRELCDLERRTRSGTADSIDHPPNGSDDVINSAAGALVNVPTDEVVEVW